MALAARYPEKLNAAQAEAWVINHAKSFRHVSSFVAHTDRLSQGSVCQVLRQKRMQVVPSPPGNLQIRGIKACI